MVWATGVVILALVVLLLALQFDGISTRAGDWIAEAVSSDGLEIEVDRVTGDWIRGLNVRGLRVTSAASTQGQPGWEASAESLMVRYRLLPLLQRTVAVETIDAFGVDIRLALAEGTSREPPKGSDEEASPWTVRFDSLDLRGVRVRIREPSTAGVLGQGPWQLSDGVLKGRDLVIGPGVTVVVDTVGGAFRPPGLDREWGSLGVSGQLREDEFRIGSLLLSSPESHLTGQGSIPLAWSGGSPKGLAFHLDAQPLHLRDLGPLLPEGVSDSVRVRLEARGRTAGDTLVLDVQGEGDVPGRIEIQGRREPGSQGHVTRTRIRVSGLDLGAWGFTSTPFRAHALFDGEMVGGLREARSIGRLEVEAEGDGGPSGTRLELTASSDSLGRPWQGDWRVRTRGIESRGTARLALGGTPSWTLDGRIAYARGARRPLVDGLDLSALRGELHVSGSGVSLDSLQARGEMRIDSARVGRGGLEGLTFTGNLASRKGSFALDGGLAGGRVEARGEADLVEGAAATIRGRLTDVDLAALLGDTVQSAVSAAFSGRLQSTAPLRASASLDLLSSKYMALTLDSASLQADLRKEEAALEGTGFLPDSGVVRASARFQTNGDESRLHLDSLDYKNLDLAPLFPILDSTTVPSTNLNGRLVGSARRQERAWEARGTLTLTSSLVGDQTLSAGRLEALLDSSRAEATLELQTPEGGLSGEGRLEEISTRPTLVVPDLRFRSLNLGAFLGRADSSLLVSGSLEGRLTGTRLEDITGEGVLRLASSRILGVSWLESVGRFTADSGQIQGILEAALKGGELHAQAEADLARELPSYRGQLSLQLPELKAGGAGRDPEAALFAQLRVRGEGLNPESAEGEVVLEVDSARWNGIPLEEGRMNLAIFGGEVRLDTLVLESSAGSASASGSLPFGSSEASDGELRFRGTLVRADLLEDLVGAEILAVGQASVEGNARGRWEALEVDAAAQISALLFNDVRIEGLELHGGFSRTEEEGLQEASARLAVDGIRLPLAPVRRVDMEFGLEDGNEVSVEASAVVDELREVRLSARVEEGREPSAIRLEAFELRADQDLWRLAHPTRIDLRNGLEIDSLLIAAEEQELRARGRVASRGSLDLQVALEGFEVATVADLLGYPRLRGEVSGSLELTGTAEDPGASLELRGSMEPPGAPPGDLTVRAQLREAKVDFQGDLTLADRSGARAQGTLPLDLSLTGPSQGLLDGEAISMDAGADSLLLAWFDPFLASTMVRDLRGTLSGDVELRGTPEAPSLGGKMALKGASASIPELGVALQGGQAHVSLDGEEIRIDSLGLRSGSGSLRGSGVVILPGTGPPEYALSLRAREFEAMARSGVKATVSGDIDLSGEGARAALVGGIQVERADLYLGDLVSAPDVEPVTLEEEDYRELARVFGYQRPGIRERSSSLWDSASLELEVRLGRASWVRQRSNPAMAVQFTGNVSVTKQPGDSLRLVGRVEGVPGRSYVEQFGRRFTLAQGEVNFRGTPAATRLDLRAEYEVPSHDNPGAPEVVISLDLAGTPDNLELALSSTPTVAASDMIAYLAAGRPAGQVLGGGDGDGEEGRGLTGAGEALALGRMSAAVEAYAREQVGLDVVEVTTDGLDGVILLAGRYVSPRLFLGVRQPLSLQRASGDASERTPNPEVEVELEALRWLLLNLQAGSSDGLEFFLRWRIGYD